ncbi:hypothetical protein TIFTF001_013199 [Ficus carica]|uniref:Uncharacterized protein n=1 Tax=Ficus carica TaxID=3494 RepID=A0AA88AHD5_FICCA|nr:hypothetical protein TIFTF001_013199 [Ficus carica]
MREYIRVVTEESGLVESIKRCGFQVAVGSSGTIRALEKAVFYGYGNGGSVFEVGKRDWRLSRGELRGVVEEMKVFGFALAEGVVVGLSVVVEILCKVYEGWDWNGDDRWRSVVRLATRFEGKKRMMAAVQFASIAKVFRGLEDRNLLPNTTLPSTESENKVEDPRQELEMFKKVFRQDLSIVVSSRTSE